MDISRAKSLENYLHIINILFRRVAAALSEWFHKTYFSILSLHKMYVHNRYLYDFLPIKFIGTRSRHDYDGYGMDYTRTI